MTITSNGGGAGTACLLAWVALSGCAGPASAPPRVALDEAVAEPATREERAEPEPSDVHRLPALAVPMPGQLKPLRDLRTTGPNDSPDETVRVSRANTEARVAPTREGYVNAIQVWPYADGALYQVYTSPGRVTLIALQAGESLVSVSAGDTVRWIVGDTVSGAGASQRVNVLVKPTRVGLKTNMIITTDRRTYLIELSSTPQAWMASASWDYPRDRMLMVHTGQGEGAGPAATQTGQTLEHLRFRYAIRGGNPSWKPLRAFDDGRKVYIEFPASIAQGELPPLFVVGAKGDGQLVNYRFRAPYYVVDRLFGAAELRLGTDPAEVVRIERSDGALVRRDGS